MSTKALTAQNCSLFEIDAELEAAFDRLQEERETTGNISDDARERCVHLFAEFGKKIDRIAAYLRTQQRKANIGPRKHSGCGNAAVQLISASATSKKS
jgi:hypothetical protein